MNIQSYILLGIVLLLAIAALAFNRKRKRHTGGCGASCSGCSGCALQKLR